MKFGKQQLSVYFALVAGVASILSVLLKLIWSNNVLFLGLLCLFLFIIIGLLFWGGYMFIHKEYIYDYVVPSIFINYDRKDSAETNFEVYKVIQCKRMKMFKYTHGYKWSLDDKLDITSCLQKIGEKRKGKSGKYDEVDLIFDEPLRFNEIATVHFLAKMKDPNYNSAPYVEQKVEKSIRYIDFRINLRTVPENYDFQAVVKKKHISFVNDASKWEIVDHVPFIKETKTYLYHLPEPESNCYYKIEWKWPQ